jgi:uncharacterized protein (DUF1810 family)
MDTPPDLQRFVLAQKPVYSSALVELQAGSKRTHWMWFIFPQIAGLGHSEMAQRYAIGSASEALAYLQHPVLGPRLRTCTQAVLYVEGRSADQIFGSPDNMKFRSSMTLFAQVATDEPMFAAALAKYFAGRPDDRTLKLLAAR